MNYSKFHSKFGLYLRCQQEVKNYKTGGKKKHKKCAGKEYSDKCLTQNKQKIRAGGDKFRKRLGSQIIIRRNHKENLGNKGTTTLESKMTIYSQSAEDDIGAWTSD